ncbi:MAG: hypothetical protein AAF439_13015 [Pseudomonadota bacterium]
MERVRAIKRRGIVGNFAALATWDDDKPLLARRVLKRGQVLFFSTLPEFTWSNFENTGLHLVLFQRCFEEGSKRLGAGFFGDAGTENALAQGDEIRSRIDGKRDDIKLSTPGNADYEAGVYRFGERTVAVNRPAEEDSLEILTNDQLGVALQDIDFSLLEESSSSSKDTLSSPAWRAFLIAMLVFLILEAILCLQPKRVETGAQ